MEQAASGLTMIVLVIAVCYILWPSKDKDEE